MGIEWSGGVEYKSAQPFLSLCLTSALQPLSFQASAPPPHAFGSGLELGSPHVNKAIKAISIPLDGAGAGWRLDSGVCSAASPLSGNQTAAAFGCVDASWCCCVVRNPAVPDHPCPPMWVREPHRKRSNHGSRRQSKYSPSTGTLLSWG